jgi:hypothetical protein
LLGSFALVGWALPDFKARMEAGLAALNVTSRGSALIKMAQTFYEPIYLAPADKGEGAHTTDDAAARATWIRLPPHSENGVYYDPQEDWETGEPMPSQEEFPPKNSIGVAIVLAHEIGHAVCTGFDREDPLNEEYRDVRGRNIQLNENSVRKSFGQTLRTHQHGRQIPADLIQ